jgi:hypothetical protein
MELSVNFCSRSDFHSFAKSNLTSNMLDKATTVVPINEQLPGTALNEVPEKISRSFSALMSPSKRKEAASTMPRPEKNTLNSNDAPKKLGSSGGRPLSVQVLGTKNSEDTGPKSPSPLSGMNRKPSAAKGSTG